MTPGPSRRPKVLAAVVVPPHLSVSGGARAAERLSAALAAHCDVTVASMMNGTGEEGAAAPFRRIPVRSWLPPLLPWSRLPNKYATLFYRSALPRLVAAGGHDIVHLHNPMPALELERTARACRRAGLPYVISTHGFNEVANGTRIYGFDRVRAEIWRRLVVDPVSRAVRRAACIFALSPADFDIVRGMGYRGEIAVVTNGVPTPAPPDPVGDAVLRSRLGLDNAPVAQRPLRCMFLANHTPNKGLPDLLAAFARLDLPFTLAIAGQQRDGVDYAAAQRACRPGQRIVVTGRLDDRAVQSLFRWTDLFVFPSLADTLPLVVLEAMAHGVPVLATRVGGIPYQVAPGTGELVAPGDVAGLAAAVSALAADPGRLVAMGEAARARVAALFTWEHAAAEAARAYRQVLARHGDPALARAMAAEPVGAG